MKQMMLLLLIITLRCVAHAQSSVVANINNLKNDEGVCRACLFSNPSSFAALCKPYDCIAVSVKNKLARAVFKNVQPGSYAVFVFHDVNNNNRMDKNFLGVPKEGYGASNNKLPFAATPHFNENKFEVNTNNNVLLNIRLRNIL